MYLRDPTAKTKYVLTNLSAIKSFIMSRGSTEESWGEPVWQEVVLTDGQRLIMWRADDELSTDGDRERRILNASVRTFCCRPSPTTCSPPSTRWSATTHAGCPGAAADVHPACHAVTQKSATETDIYCESFRYKSVDNGGLAQMQRLLQFGRVLSRCMQ